MTARLIPFELDKLSNQAIFANLPNAAANEFPWAMKVHHDWSNVSERLLIIGASVRAWVQSARAAEIDVCAYDFFADWDTCRALQTTQISPTNGPVMPSRGFIRRIQRFSELTLSSNQSFAAEVGRCDAALVCGGIETRINLIEQLASRIELLGASSAQLESLKNMDIVMGLLEQHGITIPESKIKLDVADSPLDWLRKMTGSSGGSGVRTAVDSDVFAGASDVYFQKMIPGESVSGVFVSFPNSANQIETRLLGVTRQLVGDQAVGAVGFQYCGSIGPISVSAAMADSMQAVASMVGRQFELAGLWGIDFIARSAGIVPIDFNPRLTASMELYESAIAQARVPWRSMVELHVRSCRGDVRLVDLEELQRSIAASETRVEGKAIVFNNTGRELSITPVIFDRLLRQHDPAFFGSTEAGFSIADIPPENQSISPGHPILTLRVRADRQADVWATLCELANSLLKEFQFTQ